MTMAFNIVVLCVFALAGLRDYQQHKDNQFDLALLSVTGLVCVPTFVFYFLTIAMDPGYVKKQPNFLQLLKKLISENYHLDYVCVPCETLRPENADHCNFCNRCVQKFDHHCVFVNNCVGYRNHKWFFLFILGFTVYMFGLLIHTFILLLKFVGTDQYIT